MRDPMLCVAYFAKVLGHETLQKATWIWLLCVFHVLQNKDIVQLQIGYHILEGKRMPLRKPLAILETLQTSSNSPSSGGEGGQNSSSSGDHNVSCKV